MKRYSFVYKLKTALTFGLIAALGMGCSNSSGLKDYGQEKLDNGIYYWKTTFKLNDKEREFLKKHDIQRLYLKLFDVDFGEDYDGTPRAIPIATTCFADSVPQDIEIIPVVYITQSAIHNNPDMDSLLYERIRAMGKRNGFDDMKEIQLDCDWTSESRPKFFHLCEKMRQWAHRDNILLSATIRLHQLRDSVPPVDRGVLMIYNTGSIYNPKTRNSILDAKDVKPYLKKDIQYRLPLSVAYPTYSWSIQIHNDKFYSIVHDANLKDTSIFEKIDENKYRAKKDGSQDDNYFNEDDLLRTELGEVEEILKVKDLLNEHMQSSPQSHILYHLDEKELSKYTDREIEKILK